MQRFRGTPKAPGSEFRATVRMPALPPGSSASGSDCRCTDLAVTFSGSETSASASFGVAVPFAASGAICPGTTWTFDTAWSGGGDAPTITEIGAAAWIVTGTTAGILTLTPTAHCGAATIALPALTFTVGAALGWIDITRNADWLIEIPPTGGDDGTAYPNTGNVTFYFVVPAGAKVTKVDVGATASILASQPVGNPTRQDFADDDDAGLYVDAYEYEGGGSLTPQGLFGEEFVNVAPDGSAPVTFDGEANYNNTTGNGNSTKMRLFQVRVLAATGLVDPPNAWYSLNVSRLRVLVEAV